MPTIEKRPVSVKSFGHTPVQLTRGTNEPSGCADSAGHTKRPPLLHTTFTDPVPFDTAADPVGGSYQRHLEKPGGNCFPARESLIDSIPKLLI